MSEARPLLWILASQILLWIVLGYYWPKPVMIYFATAFVVLLVFALVNDFVRWIRNPNNWRP